MNAAPVALTCVVEYSRRKEEVVILADEAHQSALVEHPKYKLSAELSATFLPNKVVIPYTFGSIEVNRVTLNIQHVFKPPIGKREVGTGICKVQPTPLDRKF